MRMHSPGLKFVPALLVLLSFVPASAADAEKIKAEDLFPENTLVLLTIPDLAATRAAFGKTQLADMFAQPEMQQFLSPAVEQLRKTYTDLRTKNPLLPALTDLDRGFLSGEITIGVFQCAGPDKLRFGVVLILRPEKFESLARLLGPAVGGDLPAEGKPFLFGEEGEPDKPALAHLNGRIVFGQPASEVTAVLERLKLPGGNGTLSAADSFAAARAQLQFSAGYLFVNPAAAMDAAVAVGQQKNDPDVAKIRLATKALGINSLNAALIGIGIANDELVLEGALHAATGQKPSGLAALMLTAHNPVSKEALKIAAVDAPYVAATQIEWSSYLTRFREFMAAMGVGRQFDGVMMMANLRLGFNLERDVLENLGSETVIVRTALDTAPPMSMGVGAVFSIALKDAAKVENCLQVLHKSFGTSLSGNPIAEMIQFRTLDYNGKTLYYLKQVMSSTWTFAVVGKRLIAGTSPNAVKRSLDQLDAKDDILSNANFQQTIARMTGKPFDAANLPGGFAFQTDESSGGSSLLMTLVGLGGSTAALALAAEQIEPKADAEQGNDWSAGNDPLADVEKFFKRPSGQVVAAVARNVDMGLWPDEGFFMKYRRARGAVWSGDANGVYFRTELPFPNMLSTSSSGSSGLITVAAIGVIAGMTMPVLGRARESARRVSSANNLSQMGKALIMYSDVPEHNDAYPADLTELFPDYVADHRLFLNPRFKGQDVAYVYIPGFKPANESQNIVVYENIPEGQASTGRNVLRPTGSVEWLDEAQFQRELEQTKEALKALGVEFKPQLVSHSQIAKKKK